MDEIAGPGQVRVSSPSRVPAPAFLRLNPRLAYDGLRDPTHGSAGATFGSGPAFRSPSCRDGPCLPTHGPRGPQGGQPPTLHPRPSPGALRQPFFGPSSPPSLLRYGCHLDCSPLPCSQPRLGALLPAVDGGGWPSFPDYPIFSDNVGYFRDISSAACVPHDLSLPPPFAPLGHPLGSEEGRAGSPLRKPLLRGYSFGSRGSTDFAAPQPPLLRVSRHPRPGLALSALEHQTTSSFYKFGVRY